MKRQFAAANAGAHLPYDGSQRHGRRIQLTVRQLRQQVASKATRALLAIADECLEPGSQFYLRYAGQEWLLRLQAMLHDGEDKLDDIHFDNRQYNFIRWSPKRLPESAKLYKIEWRQRSVRGPDVREPNPWGLRIAESVTSPG